VALVALAYMGLLAAAGAMVGAGSSLRFQLLADIGVKTAATLVGVAVLRTTGASWAELGIAGWRWPDDLRLAVGALALVVAPLLGLAAALDRLVPYEHPVVAFLRDNRDPVAVALVVVAAVVVAPIGEEFFFRRVLQGWLEQRLPEADGAAAIGLQAAAFAAAHLGHGLAAAPLLLFGIVLGVIARATGSLAPCVILHALFNAVSVGLLLATPSASTGGGG
jgi:membrane protease YdiL (CAAX protease family)